MAVSVLILTYNEAVNIQDCLRSVAWSDDVVVLDSLSSDDTVGIATASGARVFQRPFDNYASQRNYALQSIEFKHPWVLMLDADERVPQDLQDEILATLGTIPADVSLLRVRRRDHLYGRWIRGASGYPTWFGRVMRVGEVHFERPYNEETHTDGRIVSLKSHLDHFPFNKGFHEWIAKHDRYSSMEAQLRYSRGGDPWQWRDLYSADPARRRIAQKGILYSVPFRPALVFCALYLGRGAILEGRAGLTYCLLRAWYEFMIDCKFRELGRRARGLPI